MKPLLVWCIQTTCIILVTTTYRNSPRGNISFFKRTIGGLYAKLRDQQEEVTDIKVDVTDLNGEVTLLKDAVKNLSEDVSVLKEAVKDLNAELNDLRLELSPKEVDGQWTDWLHWSGCSVTCGPGQMTRERLCLDPRPANGGNDCEGSGIEHAACEITGCSDPLSAFALYVNPAVHNDTTAETTFTGVTLNLGDDYSTVTGRYTCEYPGTYVFALHLYKKPNADLLKCFILKNDQSVGLAEVPGSSDSGFYESSTTTVLHLNNNDVVSVECLHGDIASGTSFSGFLLKAD